MSNSDDVVRSVLEARKAVEWLSVFDPLRGIEIRDEDKGKIYKLEGGQARNVGFHCWVPKLSKIIFLTSTVIQSVEDGPWKPHTILFGAVSSVNGIPHQLEFGKNLFHGSGETIEEQIHDLHRIARQSVKRVFVYQGLSDLAEEFLLEVDHGFAINSVSSTQEVVVSFHHNSGGIFGEYALIEVKILFIRVKATSSHGFMALRVRLVHRSNRGEMIFDVSNFGCSPL